MIRNMLKKGVIAIYNFLDKPEETGKTDKIKYYEKLIKKFRYSKKRQYQIIGERYYKGDHDIKNKKRTLINEDGEECELKNAPNSKRIDNQYSLAVDKKVNYLLGKKPSFNSESEALVDGLNVIFDNRFHRTFKNVLKDALNCGLGYLYVYIDECSKLRFKRLKPYEVYPVWKDDEHTELELAIRIYQDTTTNELGVEESVEYMEVYTTDKVELYLLDGDTIKEKVSEFPYLIKSDNNSETWLNWGTQLPILAFKYNTDEMPLIQKIKPLQDGLNEVISMFNDNMAESPFSNILVIKNLDGTDTSKFKRNLAQTGIIKVRNTTDAQGGVDQLKVEVNAKNYETIISVFRNAIIENARSFDAKGDMMSSRPNEMNIQSMYSDIDIDSNGIEVEFKATFDIIFEIVKMYLIGIKGKSSIKVDDKAEILFSKDVLINESQVINDILLSMNVISRKTLVEKHPYINNVTEELRRIEEEEKEKLRVESNLLIKNKEMANSVENTKKKEEKSAEKVKSM